MIGSLNGKGGPKVLVTVFALAPAELRAAEASFQRREEVRNGLRIVPYRYASASLQFASLFD